MYESSALWSQVMYDVAVLVSDLYMHNTISLVVPLVLCWM